MSASSSTSPARDQLVSLLAIGAVGEGSAVPEGAPGLVWYDRPPLSKILLQGLARQNLVGARLGEAVTVNTKTGGLRRGPTTLYWLTPTGLQLALKLAGWRALRVFDGRWCATRDGVPFTPQPTEAAAWAEAGDIARRERIEAGAAATLNRIFAAAEARRAGAHPSAGDPPCIA